MGVSWVIRVRGRVSLVRVLGLELGLGLGLGLVVLVGSCSVTIC